MNADSRIGINIEGPQIDKAAAAAIADSLVKVLAAADKHHSDRETTLAAIDALGRGLSPAATINSSTVNSGDTNYSCEEDEPA